MPQFSPSQLAVLNQLYQGAGSNTVPGAWLVDGSVTVSKLNVGSLLASVASAAQGVKADTTFAWGNHVGLYASLAQGTKADTAFGWGSHAAAGYATSAQGTHADQAFSWGYHGGFGYVTAASAPHLRKNVSTFGGAQVLVTLAQTPVGDVQVFANKVLQTEGVDYMVAGAAITFGAPPGAVEVQVYYSA